MAERRVDGPVPARHKMVSPALARGRQGGRGPAAGAARAAGGPTAGSLYSPSRPGRRVGQARPGRAEPPAPGAPTTQWRRRETARLTGAATPSSRENCRRASPSRGRGAAGAEPERSLRAVGGPELENPPGSGRIPFSTASGVSRDIRIVFHVQPESCITLFEFSVSVTFSSLPEACKLIPPSLVTPYTRLSGRTRRDGDVGQSPLNGRATELPFILIAWRPQLWPLESNRHWQPFLLEGKMLHDGNKEIIFPNS